MNARGRRTDLATIRPIDGHEYYFGHPSADTIGPMDDGQYKYALVSTDEESNRDVKLHLKLRRHELKLCWWNNLAFSSHSGVAHYILVDGEKHFTCLLS